MFRVPQVQLLKEKQERRSSSSSIILSPEGVGGGAGAEAEAVVMHEIVGEEVGEDELYPCT